MNWKTLEEDRRSPLALFALLVVLMFALDGCATIDRNLSPLELLAEGENVVGTAAHTLADSADAGIIERGSDEYDKAAIAILDAGEALDRGWELYASGDVIGAVASREAAMDLYRRLVRPTLVKYSLESSE